MSTLGAGIRMALFTVVTLLATALLTVTISNATFKKANSYSAIFSDAVNLNGGDDVRMAGVRVGSVKAVHLYDGTNAKVTFTVEKDIPLSPNVTAAIKYRNLIGQRYLSLADAPGQAGTLQPHSTIPMSRTSPALNLNALFNGFKPLLTGLSPDAVNTLSYEIVQVLQGEGGNVDSLLTNVGQLSNTFADRDKLIGEVIDNLNAVLGPIDQHDQQLGSLVAELQRFLSGLSADRTAIGNSLVSINDLTATTSGFLSSVRPDLKGDIAALDSLATKLDTPQSRDLITSFMKITPDKLRVTAPSAGYGAWLNQYLCAVTIWLPNGTKTPTFFNDAKRCSS